MPAEHRAVMSNSNPTRTSRTSRTVWFVSEIKKWVPGQPISGTCLRIWRQSYQMLSACVLGVKATSPHLERTTLIFICPLLNHYCSAMQYMILCYCNFPFVCKLQSRGWPCCKDLLSNEPPTLGTKSLDWFWHVSKTNFKLNAYCVKSLVNSATHHVLGRIEFLVSTLMFHQSLFTPKLNTCFLGHECCLLWQQQSW